MQATSLDSLVKLLDISGVWLNKQSANWPARRQDQGAVLKFILSTGISSGSLSNPSSLPFLVLSCYPMRPGQQILKNFNLIIPLSKTVAIVGESGGKSTVASLLELFFDPSSGVIMLYGLDIWTLDPSQRTNNLIHQSGACRFLTGFPGGYNPVVGWNC
ncbi:mitochondrial potassium channel ATP-binding subunit-like isoform 2-T3 [Salvelinus alpinus]